MMSSIFQRDSGLMVFMTWLSNMLQVQLLWLFFSLLGLLAGGIFPATYAMFSVMRKLVQVKGQGDLNRLFWEEYKANFIKSNLLGYTLLGISLLAFFYIRMSLQLGGQGSSIIGILSLGIGLLTAVLFLYTGPVAAHFDLGIGQILKHSLIVEVSCPLHTMGIMAVVGIFFWSARHIPVLVPFVSVAIAAYFIMWIASHAFQQVERAAKRMNESMTK